MSKKQKTRFAVLGLLSWKPMSGYDIKKIVDIELSHFWNENYGQIYPSLQQLVDDGHILKSTDTKSGKRTRNTYTLTEAGENLFKDWITQPTEPLRQRNEILLKFFLSGKLPTEMSLQVVQEYREQLQVLVKDYVDSEFALRTALETGIYPADVLEVFDGQEASLTDQQKRHQCKIFLLSLRHGLFGVQGRITWCDEAAELLKEEENL
jgi:DNA-binding PadR family transcriptional regulator